VLADETLATAPGLLRGVERVLGLPHWEGSVRIYLVPDPEAGQDVAGMLPRAPEWAAGYALRRTPVIVIGSATRRGPLIRGFSNVLQHELVHVRVDQTLGDRTGEVPLWFHEGTATVLAHEGALRDVVYLARLALQTGAPTLGEIARSFPLEATAAGSAYVVSYAFIGRLVAEEGTESLGDVIRGVAQGGRFEVEFERVYGGGPAEIEKSWRRGFLWRYRWIPLLTSGTTLWLVITVTFLLGGWRKRRRNRLRMDLWEEEERARDWSVH